MVSTGGISTLLWLGTWQEGSFFSRRGFLMNSLLFHRIASFIPIRIEDVRIQLIRSIEKNVLCIGGEHGG